MKPFSINDKKGYVYALDVNTMELSEKCIKALDSEMDFYSDALEIEMNKNIEGKFFSLRDEIEKLFSERKKTIQFTHEKFMVIVNFLNLSILRGKMALDNVNNSIILSKTSFKYRSQDLVEPLMNGDLKFSIFDDNEVFIVRNTTTVNFVLPANSYYCYTNNLWKDEVINGIYVFIPITPKLIIMLIPKKDNDLFISKHRGEIMNLTDGSSISSLNRIAYLYESEFNNKFVISKTKDELINISKVINDHDLG